MSLWYADDRVRECEWVMYLDMDLEWVMYLYLKSKQIHHLYVSKYMTHSHSRTLSSGYHELICIQTHSSPVYTQIHDTLEFESKYMTHSHSRILSSEYHELIFIQTCLYPNTWLNCTSSCGAIAEIQSLSYLDDSVRARVRDIQRIELVNAHVCSDSCAPDRVRECALTQGVCV